MTLLAYGGHLLMRRKPALGAWRYRLRRALHLREDRTDLIVEAGLRSRG